MIRLPFSAEARAAHLAELAAAGSSAPPLDLLVIGGGITGVGVARDAAHRGLRVGLAERRDFAAGTSSRSSKLIHGGVRYLQLGDFALVRESALERRILGRLAPHIVRPMRMVVPARSRRSYLALNVGLWTYDRIGSIDTGERHVMWDRDATLAHVPLLRREGLHGAVAYYESVTDDARLVIDTAKDAHGAGALLANHAEVTTLHLEGGRVSGARIRDALAGAEIDVAARVVVNAAGPWVDAVRRLEGPLGDKRLHLTKGIHFTVPRSLLPLEQMVAFQARDRRTVFAVPHDAVVYVGTTDTDYREPCDHPEISTDDVDYLFEALVQTFDTPAAFDPSAILSGWAGLRPLLHQEGKAPSEISRKDEVMMGRAGLMSIAGGKLTTYRRMAARVVDLAVEALSRAGATPAALQPSRTEALPLAGGGCSAAQLEARAAATDVPGSLPAATRARLFRTYGTEAQTILDLAARDEDLASPTAPGSDLLKAEVRYALDHEMALGVEDVLERRARALLYAPDQGLASVESVVDLCAGRLGWSPEQRRAEAEGYRALARSLRPEGWVQTPTAATRAAHAAAQGRAR
jgi:glycerol-3-phosphate dehydrogenase